MNHFTKATNMETEIQFEMFVQWPLDYTASHPRTRQSSYSQPSQPRISRLTQFSGSTIRDNFLSRALKVMYV